MNMKKSTITILFQTENTDSYKAIEKHGWVGKAIYHSRNELPEIKKLEEFSKSGVYLLIGIDEESSEEVIYIGEGNSVGKRLTEHNTNENTDFWDKCIFFTTKDSSLNKAHIKYLESRLIFLAKEAKRCRITNKNDSALPVLTESEEANAENFLAEMLSIYSVLGIKFFERTAQKIEATEIKQFEVNVGGVRGYGYENNEGFVVLKDSKVNPTPSEAFPHHVKKLRERLISDGVIQKVDSDLIFAENYQFKSPSTASCLLLGRSSNGRTDWRDKDGKTLKQWQEEVALK